MKLSDAQVAALYRKVRGLPKDAQISVSAEAMRALLVELHWRRQKAARVLYRAPKIRAHA